MHLMRQESGRGAEGKSGAERIVTSGGTIARPWRGDVMLTKIGEAWIDISLVTAVEPYMDDPAKPKATVTLQQTTHVVSVTAESAATAINDALAKWKERECGKSTS